LCCVRTLTCAPASDPPLLLPDPEELLDPDEVPELEAPLDPEEPVEPVEPVDPEELPEPDEPVGVEASLPPPAPELEVPQAVKRTFPSVQATAIDAIEGFRIIQEGSRPANRLSEVASAAHVLPGRESSGIGPMSRFERPELSV
jgi:hypothetical protein